MAALSGVQIVRGSGSAHAHAAALGRLRKKFGRNFKVLKELKNEARFVEWGSVTERWQWLVRRKMLCNRHHHWGQTLCDIKSIKGYL